ncbi:MAG: outer membrane protein transport protein [Deltaproteobacteria bacterium]|nr:outer membrane protein transport protein [Deltaproteobacteria bacterium]
MALWLLLSSSSISLAAGWEIPDHGARGLGRGGAFIASANDGTAIVYNPANLAFQDGTRLTLASHFITHQSDFARAGNDPFSGAPFAPVTNDAGVFWVPFITVSSQFGLKNWTFAIGVHGPNSYGRVRFPESGGQRYSLIESNFVVIQYSFAAAWRINRRVAVGATVEWVDSRIKFREKIPLIAGSEDPANDIPSTVEVADHFGFNTVLGVRWEFVDDFVFGLSARPPIFVRATGTVTSSPPPGITISGNSAKLTVSHPVVVRAGVAWMQPRFNIEAAVVFEAWSVLDAYKTSFPGVFVNLGTSSFPISNINIPTNWRDTWSYRLGGDFEVIPNVFTLRAGAYFETAAPPPKYTALDFASLDRVGVSVGASVVWRGIELTLAYAHIFQVDRTVTDSAVVQPNPVPEIGGTPTVTGNGAFSSNFDTFSFSIGIHFDTLLK